MEFLNRDSRKTLVAQPFLAVSLCNGSRFNRDTQTLAANRSPFDFLRSLRDFPYRRFVLKLPLLILGLAVLVDLGPVALHTVEWASLVLVQIFLGLCHLGIVVCQILGM
jgi:hypothetical protein